MSDSKIPVCSIIGHVDVGKTKLLDRMRTGTTEEACGITQQIGATVYSHERLQQLAGSLQKHINIDSLLMIDTPGHECFTAIRYVAMMAADIVIIILDCHKGLEAESKRCLEYLKKSKKNIIFVVNKIDRIYGWKKKTGYTNETIKNMLKNQSTDAIQTLETHLNKIKVDLAVCEINSELYYKNQNPKVYNHIVPISAETGDGLPDLIALISQFFKPPKIKENLLGIILDQREDSKYGKYYICLHRKGTVKIGEEIHISGEIHRIKRLLHIQDDKEIKDSHRFTFVDQIRETCGFGLILDQPSSFEPGELYSTSGTNMRLYEVENLDDYIKNIGVTIVAPSRILMDALVKSIAKENIPISLLQVGKLDKPTIIKTSKWREKASDEFGKQYYQRYSIILYFNPSNIDESGDSKISKLLSENGVTVIIGNTIYSLIEKYNQFYRSFVNTMTQKYPNVFNSLKMNILPNFIFCKKNPLLFGVKITHGKISIGTKLICNKKIIGVVESIKLDNQDITNAVQGQEVCVKINNPSRFEYDTDFTADHVIENFRTFEDEDIIEKYNMGIQ